MKINDVRIFDAGGDYLDRYTAVIWYGNGNDNVMLGFSSLPYSPMGVSQYCGEWLGGDDFDALGKEINIKDLPKDCQDYVNNEIKSIINNR